MRRALAVTAAACTLGGCAAPGTPGSGSGHGYTPIIDMAGVDRARYDADLTHCRSLAQQIDAGAAGAEGVIAGAVIAGALASAFGGGRYAVGQNMQAGGLVGGAQAGAAAAKRQESVVANCLIGRGYRVLDGGYATVVPTAAPAAHATTAIPPPQSMPTSQRATGQTTMLPSQGRAGLQVEQLARTFACAANPHAALTASGAHFELFTVACDNGTALAVRCQALACRILR
jgi:hypothetical protein